MLVRTTLQMFVFPVAALCLGKRFLFPRFVEDEETQWMCAGFLAVLVVNLVLINFSLRAYRDEQANWAEKKADEELKDANFKRKKEERKLREKHGVPAPVAEKKGAKKDN